MQKAKKLIEVALPIKEISAESVRDNRLTHEHIKTLHMWWARRPLPVCRAIVFTSLMPDPLDENCSEAFKWAVEMLISENEMNRLAQLGTKAWLYIVTNCKSNPQLNIINDPANRMAFEQKTKGIQFYLPLQEWLAKKE